MYAWALLHNFLLVADYYNTVSHLHEKAKKPVAEFPLQTSRDSVVSAYDVVEFSVFCDIPDHCVVQLQGMKYVEVTRVLSQRFTNVSVILLTFLVVSHDAVFFTGYLDYILQPCFWHRDIYQMTTV